ncbi:hypothetical protein WMY93_015374 [Mugilogobius chulae]|uniref:Uncharacterized protein n=1 Tax=Mugilogobius chulae TaxID=88201 RepID=A0AAW0NR09_9GOBI
MRPETSTCEPCMGLRARPTPGQDTQLRLIPHHSQHSTAHYGPIDLNRSKVDAETALVKKSLCAILCSEAGTEREKSCSRVSSTTAPLPAEESVGDTDSTGHLILTSSPLLACTSCLIVPPPTAPAPPAKTLTEPNLQLHLLLQLSPDRAKPQLHVPPAKALTNQTSNCPPPAKTLTNKPPPAPPAKILTEPNLQLHLLLQLRP